MAHRHHQQQQQKQSIPLLALDLEDRNWVPSEDYYVQAIITGELLEFTAGFNNQGHWN